MCVRERVFGGEISDAGFRPLSHRKLPDLNPLFVYKDFCVSRLNSLKKRRPPPLHIRARQKEEAQEARRQIEDEADAEDEKEEEDE